MNMMMKRTPNLLKRSGALLLLAVLLLPACREGAQNPTLVLSDGIRFCESTYPYRDGVLVANFGTESLNPLNDEGKGYILYVTPERSEVVIPATGALSAPKGMFLRDDHLFVCDVNRVVVFNLARPEAEPQVVRLPEGELFVNDLVADGNVLYASVTNTGRIFRFDISDLDAVGAPEAWLDVPGANGMLLHDGALYVVSYPADGVTTPANVVYRIGALDNPVAERFIELPGQYDGIALSTDGRALVVSNWAPASLARIDLESRAVTPVTLELEQPLVGPADMTLRDGQLWIPDLPGGARLSVLCAVRSRKAAVFCAGLFSASGASVRCCLPFFGPGGVSILVEQVGAQCARPGKGLLLLPAGYLGEVAREKHVGNPPSAELGRPRVDGRGQQVVLEAVRQGRGLVAQRPGDEPHHRVGNDAGGQLAPRQHVVADGNLARDEVLADAVVDALVVAAEDDDVLEHREAVGLMLVVAHAVGRGVDDFVVAALGAELLDQFEDRFALHHHARLAPEGVVVGGLALVVGVVVEVVHHNFDEPLLLGPLEDGFVQRRAYQLGNDGDDIDAHLGSRLFVFGF